MGFINGWFGNCQNCHCNRGVAVTSVTECGEPFTEMQENMWANLCECHARARLQVTQPSPHIFLNICTLSLCLALLLVKTILITFNLGNPRYLNLMRVISAQCAGSLAVGYVVAGATHLLNE